MAGSSKVNGSAGIGERNFASPERSQAGGGKISPIKMAIQTKQGLEFHISKVTNCKPKVCNLVSKFQYTCLLFSAFFPFSSKP